MKKSKLYDIIAQVLREDYMDEPIKKIKPAERPNKIKYSFQYLEDDLSIFRDDIGNLYTFRWDNIDKKDFAPFFDREIIGKPDNENDEDYKDVDILITPDILESYVNIELTNSMKGSGYDDYMQGIEFVKIDKELANELLDIYNSKGMLHKILYPILKENNMKKSQLKSIIIQEVRNILKENKILLETKKLAKQKYLDTNKLTQQEFDAIEKIDPSSTKKYMYSLATWYLNGTSLDDLTPIIKLYDEFVTKKKDVEKDINKYKTFSDLKSAVDDVKESGGKSTKELEKDFDVLADTPDLYIVHPNSHPASRKLGCTIFASPNRADGQAEWCVTHGNRQWWDNHYHTKNVDLYFILVRGKLASKVPKNMQKVAFEVAPNGNITLWDVNNKDHTGSDVTNFRNIIGF